MTIGEGSVVAGRFRLVRELGRGGMGSVWLAHHVGLDTPCAVKFIHSQATNQHEVRARFEREAKAVAQLRSPHVVQVLDYGEWENMPYLAMEFLDGEDLGRRLKRVGRLGAQDTALLVSQIARALTKAHAAGLVHRDLKPENVFLVRDEEHEIAKVVDFGIAKSNVPSVGHGSTATGALLGTPHYMSPEQAQGIKAIDHRSDLFSLAVVAFRCMTGELPFESEALGDLLLKIIVQPLPVPSQMAPGIPVRFDAWWQRAAARDPAQRFQSAKELAEALAISLGVSISVAMHVQSPSSPGYDALAGYHPHAAAMTPQGLGFTPMHSPTGGVPAAYPSSPGVPAAYPSSPGVPAPYPSSPGVQPAVPHVTMPGISRTFADEPVAEPPRKAPLGLIAAAIAIPIVLGGGGALVVFGLPGGARTAASSAAVETSAPASPTPDPAQEPESAPAVSATGSATAAASPAAPRGGKTAASPAKAATATPGKADPPPAKAPEAPPRPAAPATTTKKYDPGI